MGTLITGVAAYVTRLPLIRPYHLSFGSLKAYDSLIVRILADGKEGFGEATDCPGYFVEGLSDAWEFVCRHAPELPGENPGVALKRIVDKEGHPSFAATPLLTGLESLAWSPGERPGDPVRFPLLGVVQGETPQEIITDARRLLELGHRTLKFKVGFSVSEDLNRVRHLQAILEPGRQLRLDANQGYSYPQTLQFLEGLDPARIELLEQPLQPDAWEEMARLVRISPIPLMLDEGIVKDEDLDRAIETGCAKAVKFKLMKCGSFAHLERQIKKASNARLKVVLGNGVATDIGCFHEARIAVKMGLTVHAGEMNGFLKGREQFLQPRLKVDKGDLIIPSPLPGVRLDLISKFAVEKRSWGDVKVPD